MTNLEIVEKEVVERGFLTEEECGIIIGKYGELPYKTYQEWKYSGYQVKRGSKAVIKTKRWKKVSKKKDEESEDKENKKVSNFVMVTASLFDLSQVEKIEA